jgi:tight adherence protein C
MELLIIAGVFGGLMIVILSLGRRMLSPARSLEARIGARQPARAPAARAAAVMGPQSLERIAARLPSWLRQSSAELNRLLTSSGFSSDRALTVFQVARAGACALLVLGGILLGGPSGQPHLQIGLPACGAFAAFYGSMGVLKRLTKRRCERLRLGLPDALDLLVVCVEAGLGIDQAILKVSKELKLAHADISQELDMVHLEMRAGIARAEALRNIGDRTGSVELRKLAAVLIQTDRFGTSMAESLRTHADFLRVRRRQEAEERAAKVGVKLVFPIFFFLLPAMLVVAAGPGLLQLFKNLLPLMRGAE